MSGPSTLRHEDKRERQCSSKIRQLIEFEGHFSSCLTTKVVYIVLFHEVEDLVISSPWRGKSGSYVTGDTASQPRRAEGQNLRTIINNHLEHRRALLDDSGGSQRALRRRGGIQRYDQRASGACDGYPGTTGAAPSSLSTKTVTAAMER